MFLPPAKRILCFLSAQKPKGGPLEEKNIFFKRVLSFIQEQAYKFPKNILEIRTCSKMYFGPCNPVHANLLLSKAFTGGLKKNVRFEQEQAYKFQKNILEIKTCLKLYFGPCALRARWPPTEQSVGGACTVLHGPKYNFKHVFIPKIFFGNL